jgi:dTDP-D-glucose 4,6-dehydratase
MEGTSAAALRPRASSSVGHQPYTKRILVTGGAGFIGSHVVIRLVKTYPQYKVVVLDKLDYCGSLKHLESVASCPNYSFVKVGVDSTCAEVIRAFLLLRAHSSAFLLLL